MRRLDELETSIYRSFRRGCCRKVARGRGAAIGCGSAVGFGGAVAGASGSAAGSSGESRLTVEPDQAAHVVDKVREARS